MRAEKVRVLADRAKHLTAIHESPSWPVVRDTMTEKIEKEVRKLVGPMVTTNEEMHYGRGYIRGMQVMLVMVENGEKAFEEAVATARTLEEEGVN